MLFQYNNIYTSLHKYLKEKKKNKQMTKKKKIGIVATVSFGTVATLKNTILTNVTRFSQNIYFQL